MNLVVRRSGLEVRPLVLVYVARKLVVLAADQVLRQLDGAGLEQESVARVIFLSRDNTISGASIRLRAQRQDYKLVLYRPAHYIDPLTHDKFSYTVLNFLILTHDKFS